MTSKSTDTTLAENMEAVLNAYGQITNTIIQEHDTYMEVDISNSFYPDQTLLIDKEDYEMLMNPDMGRITARATQSPIAGIVATLNTRAATGKFKLSSTYVHSLLCEGRGYLYHRNANLLDNRRENLETDIPWEIPIKGRIGPSRYQVAAELAVCCLDPKGTAEEKPYRRSSGNRLSHVKFAK